MLNPTGILNLGVLFDPLDHRIGLARCAGRILTIAIGYSARRQAARIACERSGAATHEYPSGHFIRQMESLPEPLLTRGDVLAFNRDLEFPAFRGHDAKRVLRLPRTLPD